MTTDVNYMWHTLQDLANRSPELYQESKNLLAHPKGTAAAEQSLSQPASWGRAGRDRPGRVERLCRTFTMDP